MENVSMNSKVIELVQNAVDNVDDEHRQLQQAFSKGLKKAAKK